MKFKDLAGKVVSKDISKYKRLKNLSNASNGEKLLGAKLDQIFPGLIYQQMPCFGTRLRLDFYIHLLKLAFEFDGEQHSKYIPYFHGSRHKFQASKDRDCMKDLWCEKNQIRLIRLKKSDIERLEELI